MNENLKHVDSSWGSSIFSRQNRLFNCGIYFIFNLSKPQSGNLITEKNRFPQADKVVFCVCSAERPDLV